ncbi:MAG: glycosyltransferase family 4 protein, partial [Myxococcota bacterium]
MTKILLFCHEWMGWRGGAEHYIATLSTQLRKIGLRTELVYLNTHADCEGYAACFDRNQQLNTESELIAYCTDNPPTWMYLHRWSAKLFVKPQLRSIQKLIMLHDAGLFCPRQHKYTLWTERTCEHPMGPRCALHCAQVAALPGRHQPNSAFQRKQEELRALQDADTIVVGSHYMKQMLHLHGVDTQNTRVLPLAFSDLFFKPQHVSPSTSTQAQSQEPKTSTPRSSSSIQSQGSPVHENQHKPFQLLFVGSMLRSKGIDLLLFALQQLDFDWECRIVGHGAQAQTFKFMAKWMGFGQGQRQNQQVVFEGSVDRSDLPQRYTAADLLIFPSRTPESFGLVGAEALACGTPVVAFDVGGISEWLHHRQHGWLVPRANASMLADAIRTLPAD